MEIVLCLILTTIGVVPTTRAYKILWDNDLVIELNEIDEDIPTKDDERLANWLFIYPGTKWCGAGDIAANASDLGTQRDTDKCCRAHDMCPDIIEAHQTKYGLENPSSFTRLSCKCDKDFYKCLKSVDTTTSGRVGTIYFTLLGTQCFREDYPVTGCKTYNRGKCIEPIYDTSQPKKYQWFDIPDY